MNNQSSESSYNQLGFSEMFNKVKLSVSKSHRAKPKSHCELKQRRNWFLLHSCAATPKESHRDSDQNQNPNLLIAAAPRPRQRRAASANPKTIIHQN